MDVKAKRRANAVATDAEILVGNSQIAAVLGVGATAVRRLHKEAGLPLAVLGWSNVSTRPLLRQWVEKFVMGAMGG